MGQAACTAACAALARGDIAHWDKSRAELQIALARNRSIWYPGQRGHGSAELGEVSGNDDLRRFYRVSWAGSWFVDSGEGRGRAIACKIFAYFWARALRSYWAMQATSG